MVKYDSWRHEVTQMTICLLTRGADTAGGTAPHAGHMRATCGPRASTPIVWLNLKSIGAGERDRQTRLWYGGVRRPPAPRAGGPGTAHTWASTNGGPPLQSAEPPATMRRGRTWNGQS